MKIRALLSHPAIVMLIVATAAPAVVAGGSSLAFQFGHPGEAQNVKRVITIRADDMFMDPRMITVKAGETVKFVVTNTGKLPHEFVLGDKAEQARHEKEMQAMQNMSMQGMDMKDMGSMSMQGMSMMDNDPNGIMLKPGETRVLIWTFTQPGTIEYACHEPGHYAAGMVGTITIKPSGQK